MQYIYHFDKQGKDKVWLNLIDCAFANPFSHKLHPEDKIRLVLREYNADLIYDNITIIGIKFNSIEDYTIFKLKF